ncbi:unnamed protein product [Prunus armeniaca]
MYKSIPIIFSTFLIFFIFYLVVGNCNTFTSWHRPWHGFDVLHHAKASQGCVGGALVKQDKVGRHVFWAGNWQPRHGRSAAQHTRKVAQRARQAAQCKAALNAQGRLHSARGQIVLDVGKTVFEQSMGGWTWLKVLT